MFVVIHLDTVEGVYVSFNSAGLALTVDGIFVLKIKKLFLTDRCSVVISLEALYHSKHGYSMSLVIINCLQKVLPCVMAVEWMKSRILQISVFLDLCECSLAIPPAVRCLSIFRWFKFTLKPSYTVVHGNLLSAIWDTSHWTSFVKFGLKTA